MTTMKAIMAMMGLISRSFDVSKSVRPKRPDISTKRVPPRSMTPEEKEYYDKHKNLNGFYSNTEK